AQWRPGLAHASPANALSRDNVGLGLMGAKPAEAKCLLDARALLGECPVWDERGSALYFVDIEGPALFRLDPASGIVERWAMPARIGCFALDRAGGAIVALAAGFHHFDFKTAALAPLANPLVGQADHRFNDGAADPAGRFWAGTMHLSARRPSGKVYCLERNGKALAVYDGFFVPNGFAWSPDGARFFINDSPRAMFVADYDTVGGRAGPPFVFADKSAAPGYPDGMAVDAEGYLWNARWDGGGIARFAPDGRLDRFVHLPVSRPTSCAFGGPGFDRLFVTSARIGLDEAALAREPLAGGVFVIEPGVTGLPARRWRGPA
ncbi:MAG: SMP-30/gluconolactonase/LRE family protein, partial [Alphaproteobacteria bacterium]